MISTPKHWRRLLFVLVVGSGFVRLVGLDVFPDIQADEGLWTNSSKNFLVFGDWFMDGRTHLFLSPAFHLLSILSFEVLGPSMAAARIVSGIAGTVSVVLLYAIVTRLSGSRQLAVTTAALFGFNYWGVVSARYALIESTELAFILAAVLALTVQGRRATILASVLLAASLLAKVNVVFIYPVLVCWALSSDEAHEHALGDRLRRVGTVTAASCLLAGAVYFLLFRWEPTLFAGAFTHELDGVHFESMTDPLVRVGRFGLEPEKAARSVVELFRTAPFLCALACLGLTTTLVRRTGGNALFFFWVVLGGAFFLLQMFQPTRYLFLLIPGLCFFGALTLRELVRFSGDSSRVWMARIAPISIVLAFNLSYIGMSAFANRSDRLPTITEWVHQHTTAEDVILTTAYLATDLDRRAYAHYSLARTPEELQESIGRHGIDFIIVDDGGEWNPEIVEFVHRGFPQVQVWSFGAVYRIPSPGIPPNRPEP